MSIPFDNTYARLPERFYSRQSASSVPSPKLIRANKDLAATLRIAPDWLDTPDALDAFSGNAIPQGAEPIAQAYAGHQFGNFVPQLGDGRAVLLGEVIGEDRLRRDIQLKGSGQTAFSRNGDGKSALGPVLREYIVSEAMTALGIPSTRALAAVVTGETVFRQEGSVPGGVFTRVAASHLRVGTFQYFLARQDSDALRELADYAIARHYPTAAEADSPYLALLEAVVAAQAQLIPQWMSIGFIHGVMNTDNCAISGETIDYGPCAFMDAFHPKRVFSSIDTGGRYAWNNQPDIALWNLTRFAETLLPLLDDDEQKAISIAEAALKKYPDQFSAQYQKRFRAKLALPSDAPNEIIQECLDLLADHEVDFTLFFRHLTRIASGDTSEALEELFKDKSALEDWLGKWRSQADCVNRLLEMRQANPILIPRNHRIEQAIQAAYRNDYGPFNRLVEALANPYSENPDYADLELAPEPHERVSETFCGT